MRDRGSSSDPVVRLSAAEALKECVDVSHFRFRIIASLIRFTAQTVEFDVQTFQPFLGDFVTELLRLMAEVDTLESKTRLTKALNMVIERAGNRVRIVQM